MACPSRDNLDFEVRGDYDYSQFKPDVVEAKDLRIIEWDLEDDTPPISCMGYAELRKPIIETRENQKYMYPVGVEVKLGSVGDKRTFYLNQHYGLPMLNINNGGKKTRRNRNGRNVKKYRGKASKNRRNVSRNSKRLF